MMSTEKRPPTADEIATLIVEAEKERGYADKFTDRVNAADSDESGELLDLAMGGLAALEDCNLRLADALESQCDELKQAREIMRRVPHQDCRDIETPPDTCRFGATEIWSKRLLCIDARAWLAANPAPTTESEHGND